MDLKTIKSLLLKVDGAKLAAAAAKRLCQTRGAHVYCRGLIEFSNICRRNCIYCGLRRQNKKIRRYRMSHAEIMRAAAAAVASGVDTIVLQSGEGAADSRWLARVVSSIKRGLGVAVTLSVGECPSADYEMWRAAGADRYLLKHETSDPLLYATLHPGYSLKDRLECVKSLAALGYETGGGFMVGIPGQTLHSLALDIELCARLKLDMCGVGPFLPRADTPLGHLAPGSADMTLRVISILRLALPYANLPATTALASADAAEGQKKGLLAGANVLMPSFTPAPFAASYSIYDHKNRVDVKNAAAVIEAAGRSHSLKPD